MSIARKKAKYLKKKKGMTVFWILLAIVVVLAGALLAGAYLWRMQQEQPQETVPSTTTQTTTAQTEPPHAWRAGYLATMEKSVNYRGGRGAPVGTLPRGAAVQYELTREGKTAILINDNIYYLPESASVVEDPATVIPAHTLYVRTAVNLRDVNGNLLEPLAEKGAEVAVTGCDYTDDTGAPHMYRVNYADTEGYILPWYLETTQEAALANYDAGSYQTHVDRGDSYGGGDAAYLDYFPREKGPIPGNHMPSETRALYMATWSIDEVDQYLAIAKGCDINAFVVDIVDGGAVGYAAEVMQSQCPSAVSAASNTVEAYQAAIQKLKDAGYYVIGRISTFNDTYFTKDHPECAISDLDGDRLKLSGEYWPSAYSRTAWQYKVDLALEAVELMGFHEIQFDYVRFPDRTYSYEKAGTIDFRNTYEESKAQAIQRFLMYATDRLHEKGVYVSADVYGESAFTYVTAYGQYWPAISNVVDAISGMPYPDHFGAQGDWLPWEHPYDMLNSWGKSVMTRQGETATPAAVRTWIQAYNAIKAPYNTYGPAEITAQVNGLRDAGCTGGYMTWNGAASVSKYQSLMPAFTAP